MLPESQMQTQARAALDALIGKFYALPDADRRLLSEESVKIQFITPLLRDVLGWPIDDTARFTWEMPIKNVGRADMMLTPESGGAVLVEAKRFGVIKDLAEARRTISGTITPGQLALPGMATDRTREEQQAINYAFQTNNTWAILTDFQHFRLFNARRDWLVLSFEKPEALRDDFDLLWRLAYPNILIGSLDDLSNLRLLADIDSNYLRFINEWREKLAQDIINHVDRNPWVRRADGSPDLPLLRATVQRFLDRLVIVRYAEDHLIMPPGTLQALYDIGRVNIYVRTLDMLRGVFQRFDEYHNSALFAPSPADRIVLDDKETLLPLLNRLYEARYRSMPADIMGNTYEQYLGKTLTVRGEQVVSTDNLETRKKQGSYYTPQVIVRYLVDHSLGRYLYATENGRADGTPIANPLPGDPVPGESRKTSHDISDLRVLDSACGSGSFLIYAYQVLAEFYQREQIRLNQAIRDRITELARQGSDSIAIEIQVAPMRADLERIADYPRLILENHLYGVDLDPQAAEIAVVNLMMRAMESRAMKKDQMLPLILNQNVKVGNALVGLRAEDMTKSEYVAARARIRALRLELIATPHGERHDLIVRELEAATDSLKAELNPALGDHFPAGSASNGTIEAIRPFHWGAEFPEVFFDAAGEPLPNPGFTIIIGNPPWEILKPDQREFYAQFDPRVESQLSRVEADKRIAELDAEDPDRRVTFTANAQNITQTVGYTRHSGAYTRQGKGDPATQKLFLERMYGLLRRAGRIGYVIPSGIYTDLGTKDLRQMLLDDGHIQYIYSFSNERGFFPDVDHRFKLALIGAQKTIKSDGFWATFRFNPRVAIAPDDMPAFLDNRANLMYIRRDSLIKFSPDSLGVMEFQSKQDYGLAEKIYGSWPTLGQKIENGWNISFTSEFHMTNDRDIFNTNKRGLPLYEGKKFHQYNAFFAPPALWVEPVAGRKRLLGKMADNGDALAYQKYRLAVRAIARGTDERTLIATLLPPNVFAGNSALVERDPKDSRISLYVSAIMDSFCLDYILRLKVAANINMFFLYQLPVPRLTPGDPTFEAIVSRAARLTCTRAEFADLWLSVTGTAWTESSGAIDPAERQQLRAEIDQQVAHLYGLTAAELSHVLASFPLVSESIKAAVIEGY